MKPLADRYEVGHLYYEGPAGYIVPMVTGFDQDERVERAWTLPARFYGDPAILELEKRRIFNRTWQLVGRLDQVTGPGGYFTTDIVGEPILVVRDGQANLRGFFNVCRHRAGPVARGSGCRRSFQCGYHGWTYALDGELIGAPEFDGVEDFNKEDFRLSPIRIQTWEQFIFANLDPASPPLESFLEDIPDQLCGRNISEMRLVERRDYTVECNWKVYVDNYLEGYHIPIVHPSLMRELDYTNYKTITRMYYSLQEAPIRPSQAEAAGRRYASPEEQTEALYYWIFPNLMLNVYPDNMSINLIIPISHRRTLTIFEWYFCDPESEEVQEKIQRTIRFSDEIQQEDIAICEAVEKGLRSISYDRGRYSAKREAGVHHFHLLWREFMGA
jgi:choline monooxygenase